MLSFAAAITSPEVLVDPGAHDVAVEACRGLHVVRKELDAADTGGDAAVNQQAVVGHAAEIIVEILDLN